MGRRFYFCPRKQKIGRRPVGVVDGYLWQFADGRNDAWRRRWHRLLLQVCVKYRTRRRNHVDAATATISRRQITRKKAPVAAFHSLATVWFSWTVMATERPTPAQSKPVLTETGLTATDGSSFRRTFFLLGSFYGFSWGSMFF